jgi:putrescine aminotransferase
LIFDEVQTGMGRTGALFLYQALGVTPDILVYAKGFSGGLLPIGGFTTSPEIFKRAYPRIEDHGLHASTFGGNSLSCAVARAALSLIDEPLLAKVRGDGDYLAARLGALAEASPLVEAARGRGLLFGVALKAAPAWGGRLAIGLSAAVARRLLGHWVALRLLERGFVTETATYDERVVRIEPALIAPRALLSGAVDALGEILAENERFSDFVTRGAGRLLAQALTSRVSD